MLISQNAVARDFSMFLIVHADNTTAAALMLAAASAVARLLDAKAGTAIAALVCFPERF
jgi:hypothetical protein